MKRRTTTIVLLLSCVAILLPFVWLQRRDRDPFSPDADRVLLLLPDGTNFSDPRVTVWLDAASEEGLHIVPMHDSNFLRPLFGRPRCAGVILPDSIHREASDLLVGAIREYVSAGGQLMLVYDAATKSQNGFYAGERSRLSSLAGVDYALYDSLREGMIN